MLFFRGGFPFCGAFIVRLLHLVPQQGQLVREGAAYVRRNAGNAVLFIVDFYLRHIETFVRREFLRQRIHRRVSIYHALRFLRFFFGFFMQHGLDSGQSVRLGSGGFFLGSHLVNLAFERGQLVQVGGGSRPSAVFHDQKNLMAHIRVA